MRRAIPIGCALLLVACAPQAPRTAVERDGTTVRAPLAKSWDAVIDLFARRNIPIKTIDRSSGLVVTELMQARSVESQSYADCGTNAMSKTRLGPTHGAWNVLVRGDSTTSVVKVTPRFIRQGESRVLFSGKEVVEDCASTGILEGHLESEIKGLAESAAMKR